MKHKLFSYAVFLFAAISVSTLILNTADVAAAVPTYTVDSASEVMTISGGTLDIVTGSTRDVDMPPPAAGNNRELNIPDADVCNGGVFQMLFDIRNLEDLGWAIFGVAEMNCVGGEADWDSGAFDEVNWWTPGPDQYMLLIPTTPPSDDPPSTTPPTTPRLGDPRFGFWSAKSKDGEYIRACDGIFEQFIPQVTSSCLEFVNTKEEEQNSLVWRSADATIADKLASGCSSPGPAMFTFELTLVQPTNIVEEETSSGTTRYGLPANVRITEQNGNCSTLQLNDMANNGILETIVWGANDIDTLMGGPVEGVGESRTSVCQIEGGLSWILCPIMKTVAMINDGAFSLIENFLRIPPMMMSGENNDAYEVWKSIRNIANVLFAIVFLVVIYSQLTSAGISNYGIKKMLPKMLIGVILVNASFILVALAVDLSNVVGSATYQVMRGFGGVVDESSSIPTWQTVTSNTLAGLTGTGAALAIGVMVGVSVLLPMAIGAIFMLVGLVFLLTFRHAMIFILAIVAPLAFVAYMLPNTEGLFKSWFKLLRVLLYIYPAVAFIMGASVVAAGVTFSVSQNMEGVAGWVMMIIATAMPAMAIFAALMIAKSMGSVAGKLGLQNPFGGIINAAKERGAAWGRNADGAMSNTKFGGRVGGIGQNRRYSRDFKQGMRDEANKNLAQARSLGTRRGQNAFNVQGGAQQAFNSAKSKAEVDELTTNQTLHVNAEVDNLQLDAAKSQLTAQVSKLAASEGTDAFEASQSKWLTDQASASSSAYGTTQFAQNLKDTPELQKVAAGADSIGQGRAVAYATHTLNKRQQEIIGQVKETMSDFDHDQLDAVMKDDGKSVEERMAAAGTIASRNYREGKIKMLEYLGDEANDPEKNPAMKEIQMQAYQDSGGNLSEMMGTEDLGNIERGAFVVKTADRMTSSGAEIPIRQYMMNNRLAAGKVTSKKLATLDPDDLKSMDQLLTSGNMSEKALRKTQEYIAELRKPENATIYAEVKGQHRELFERILPSGSSDPS